MPKTPKSPAVPVTDSRKPVIRDAYGKPRFTKRIIRGWRWPGDLNSSFVCLSCDKKKRKGFTFKCSVCKRKVCRGCENPCPFGMESDAYYHDTGKNTWGFECRNLVCDSCVVDQKIPLCGDEVTYRDDDGVDKTRTNGCRYIIGCPECLENHSDIESIKNYVCPQCDKSEFLYHQNSVGASRTVFLGNGEGLTEERTGFYVK